MTARDLEALMVRTFGADFRKKVLVGPCESWPLAACFEECGLRDPRAVPTPVDAGLWQTMPVGRY